MSFVMKLTATGAAKIAAANAGAPVALTQMAVGDGAGVAAPAPTGAEIDLVNEVWRDALTSLSVSLIDPEVTIAEAVIPTAAGPFTVREIGIFDVDGDLIAYGNFPETFKPAPAGGAAREMLIRAMIRVASTENVTILIDESAIFATQAWSNARFLQKSANLSDVADAATARANIGAAPLSNPIFTDNPRAPTPPVGDNDTSLATTAFVHQFFSNLDMTQIGGDLPLSGGSPGFANIPGGFRNLLIEVLGATTVSGGDLQLEVSDNGADWASTSFFRISAPSSDVLFGTGLIFGYRRRTGIAFALARHLPSNRTADFNEADTSVWRVDAGISHMRFAPGPNFNGGIARLWGF